MALIDDLDDVLDRINTLNGDSDKMLEGKETNHKQYDDLDKALK